MCRHHVIPRDEVFVPKESPFPIPLTHVDATGQKQTNFDVLKETCLDNAWNVDKDRV